MARTRPLHTISSISKATMATPGVASPMPQCANGQKRKLTLQAHKQKRKEMKATASCIKGLTTQVISVSTPTVSTPNPALTPSRPPPNQASNSMSLAPSVISVGIFSVTNLSHLQSPHPSSSASQFIPSSPPNTPSSLSVSSKQYGSRSVLAPGDLRVTAILETIRRMMEKIMLSERPFPTEAELMLVAYTIQRVVDTD